MEASLQSKLPLPGDSSQVCDKLSEINWQGFPKNYTKASVSILSCQRWAPFSSSTETLPPFNTTLPGSPAQALEAPSCLNSVTGTGL